MLTGPGPTDDDNNDGFNEGVHSEHSYPGSLLPRGHVRASLCP